ncbi:MAG: YegS/Rv2252/BmrU family lipid kinase [Eubacteriales bacterium]
MSPLLFIYNPTAGKGDIARHLGQIIEILSRYGWLVTAYPTERKGDGADVVRRIGIQYERIICAGGDGTLSEIASQLMELDHPPPLGYIPFGSTNDSANTFQLPKDLSKAVQVAAGGRVEFQDMGLFNESPFLYVAAFGAFASVSYGVPQELKNMLGSIAYVMQGVASLPTITPHKMKVEIDGHVIEDEFLYGMVCNTYTVGGLKALSPDLVALDDGLFEVVLVRKEDGINAVFRALQSLVLQTPFENGSILSFRAKELTFTSENNVPWTLDGEFGGEEKVNHIQNIHCAIKVVQGSPIKVVKS